VAMLWDGLAGSTLAAVIDPERRVGGCSGESGAGLRGRGAAFLLLGAPILLAPAIIAWNEAAATGGGACRGPYCVAVLPVSLCVLGWMIYNDLRFDSPSEFGQRYNWPVIGRIPSSISSLRFLWFNFSVSIF